MKALDHPIKPYKSFNMRYMMGEKARDPDFLDWMMRIAHGEFSIHTDITFEKHLTNLRKWRRFV